MDAASIKLIASASAAAAVVYLLRRRALPRTVSSLSDLSDFDVHEVLMEGEFTVVLGRFSWQPPEERALIKLSVKPVPLAVGLMQSLDMTLSSFSGAEYAYYHARSALRSLVGSANLRPSYSLEVVAPASEKQIARARPQPGVLIAEDAALYNTVVHPYIHGLDPRATSWIDKVLDLSKERERVLFNDPNEADGFLLNVDTKWKSHPPCVEDAAARATWHGHDAVRDLYCLAICHRHDVQSMRDLRAAHLPLLKRILAIGTETVSRVYGVPPDCLRVFVHYQPQFYHFHVHFTRLHSDVGCQVERAHLLADIIANLEGDDQFYAKRTLHYQLKQNDKLLAKICEAAVKPAQQQPEQQAAQPEAANGKRRQRSPPAYVLRKK